MPRNPAALLLLGTHWFSFLVCTKRLTTFVTIMVTKVSEAAMGPTGWPTPRPPRIPKPPSHDNGQEITYGILKVVSSLIRKWSDHFNWGRLQRSFREEGIFSFQNFSQKEKERDRGIQVLEGKKIRFWSEIFYTMNAAVSWFKKGAKWNGRSRKTNLMWYVETSAYKYM